MTPLERVDQEALPRHHRDRGTVGSGPLVEELASSPGGAATAGLAWRRAALSGASVALATGLMWLLLVVLPLGIALPHQLAWLEGVAPPLLLGATVGSWVVGGAGFARAANRGRGAAAAVGMLALVVTVLGLALALRVEHVAVEERGVDRALLPLVFTLAFAPYLGALVFALTLAVGRAWRPALVAAALTVGVYALVGLALAQLPGWRVGGGGGAMLRVALVANTLAGLSGGVAANLLLRRARGRLERRD